MDNSHVTTASAAQDPKPSHHTPRIITVMNLLVLLLSTLLIVFISIDTFEKVDFLQSHRYMTFQFWVCIFFMIDFFVELAYAPDKWSFTKHRITFLFLSIPYLNIINLLDIHISGEVLYFVRFIPLARGALAMSIVMGYLSSNAVTSLFMSYLVILLMITYFCSLIFYEMEQPCNPQVQTYWSALWWAFMNMSTVGCDISPVTVVGKLVAVVLPIMGMVIFPLFTVYLTDYVQRMAKWKSN
ncbi:potassium channel family protein [uncultured Duncaniella sp.]|uniref:potassium channel family protein n=1 Tax=uncultured Duncaniella sp. TaxID=2768039 RepID=UPI0026749949|nr:potassium channel family protein [uncultured Duncaniella sp.]